MGKGKGKRHGTKVKKAHRGQRSTLQAIARLPEWARGFIEDSRSAPAEDVRKVIQGLQDYENKQWYYLDREGQEQGPFKTSDMQWWYVRGRFPDDLKVRLFDEFWDVSRFYNSKRCDLQ